METVTSADGTRIAYDRTGSGTPLVLIHGGGTHAYWDPLVPALAERFTVVRPDRRGRGESGDADEYALQREVEDARAVIDAVDGDPVVFGHSFGGRMAIEAARERAVSAVAAYEPAYLVGEYAERADLADRMESHLADGDREAAMKAHLETVIHGDDADDLDAWLAEWPAWPDCVADVEQDLRMDRAIEANPLDREMAVDAPALLLTGTAGPSHLRDSIRVLEDVLADAELREFEGLGHLGVVEAPEEVTEALLEFVDGRVEVAGRA